ncbi:MAG: hypothetical protein KAZ30_00915 [Candidatus Magasanikbacteria bacterium]|nr:hypothetical protein [Candidatus Magasanikbacteria bacterium]
MSLGVASEKNSISDDRLFHLQQKHAELMIELQDLKKEYIEVEAEVNELIRKSDLKSILEKISSIK